MAEPAGLYAALPTAFDTTFAYDGTAQAALARHARSLGMEGVFVGGSTAEVHSFSLGERLAGPRDVAEALASGTGASPATSSAGRLRERLQPLISA